MPRASVCRLLPLVLALAALPAQAQLYKWVDEQGVVNYGDAPPPKARKVQPLDESRSTLSVVPGMSKDELARQQQRAEQARIDRLERELAELRDRPPAPPQVIVQPSEPVYYPVYGTWRPRGPGSGQRPPQPRPEPRPQPPGPTHPVIKPPVIEPPVIPAPRLR